MVARRRTNKPVIPVFFAYKSTGEDACDTFIAYDTIHLNTGEFQLSADYKEILIKKAGFYEITIDAGYDCTGTARYNCRTYLYLNGVALPGAVCGTYHRTTLDGEDSASIHWMQYLEKNDVVSVYADADAKEVHVEPGFNRIMIKFIPVRGWNNNAGGKIDYRGGVMR